MGGRYLLQPLLETTICHIMCSLNCYDHPPLKVCYNKGLRVTWAEFESCLIYVQPGSSSLTSPISNQFRSKWGIWTPTAEDVVTPFWVKVYCAIFHFCWKLLFPLSHTPALGVWASAAMSILITPSGYFCHMLSLSVSSPLEIWA